MATGIELIAQERAEQILKHGRTVERDVKENNFSQLIDGAIGLLCQRRPNDKPSNWDDALWEKMCAKPYSDKLITAGALIAAEIDRFNFENKIVTIRQRSIEELLSMLPKRFMFRGSEYYFQINILPDIYKVSAHSLRTSRILSLDNFGHDLSSEHKDLSFCICEMIAWIKNNQIEVLQ